MDSNYSLSDLAAVTNEGFGGNNALMFILLFALIFGNGGFGRNMGDYGQFATAASQQEILFGQQFQGIDNKIDRIGNGIADATFALNNSIKDGNSAVAGAVVGEGRAIQSQIANCCCENLRNTDALRYDMATMNCDTKAVIHAEGEATRNLIQQNKIESLQARVSQLETANAINTATAGVVKYPMASTYNMGGNPFCNCGNGCGNGCGC